VRDVLGARAKAIAAGGRSGRSGALLAGAASLPARSAIARGGTATPTRCSPAHSSLKRMAQRRGAHDAVALCGVGLKRKHNATLASQWLNLGDRRQGNRVTFLKNLVSHASAATTTETLQGMVGIYCLLRWPQPFAAWKELRKEESVRQNVEMAMCCIVATAPDSTSCAKSQRRGSGGGGCAESRGTIARGNILMVTRTK